MTDDPNEQVLPSLPSGEDNSEELEERPLTRLSKWRLRGRSILKEFSVLLIIIFFVFIFRSIVFEPFKIPTGSMIPTLKIGDFILVNKFSYGLKVPFSDLSFGDVDFKPIYLTGPKKVERGDVIVFKYPKDPNIIYIKRVIGLPGETIEVKDKFVYINGKKLSALNLPAVPFMDKMDEKYKNNNLAFYATKLKDKKFVYQVDQDNFYKVNFKEKKIPEGHYFVMGDNRDFSYDSRYWGVIPFESIKGKAFLVWLSLNFRNRIGEGEVIRSERTGLAIE